MVFTDYGRSGASLLMAGSVQLPRYCAIGNGSGANVATLGSLISEALALRKDYTSRDISVQRETSFVFDFTSIEMSGIALREFGIGGLQASGTNDLWVREGFPAIQFDSTNELQVELIFRSY